MGILERFIGKPQKEVGVLNREQIGRLVDKLLDDLQNGYIVEDYNGDADDEERLLQDIRNSVVLKRGKKYFLVHLFRGYGDRDTDFHRSLIVHEYRSLEEMNGAHNDLPFAVFKEGQKIWGYSGYFWSDTDGSYGWKRLDLDAKQTKSFLAKVAKASVNTKATQEQFNSEIASRDRYGWTNIKLRWPKLKKE